MKNSRQRIHVSLLVAAACFVSSASIAQSEEPARRFLDGLLERGDYEDALEYLKQLESSPEKAGDLRDTIDLERGNVALQAARSELDTMRRASYQQQAEESFKKFLADHPKHTKADTAKQQLANLHVERARVLVERSKREKDEKRREEFRTQARGHYDKAEKTFQTQIEQLKNQLKAAGLAPNQLKRLRLEYLQVKLLHPAVLEETAETYAAESKFRDTALREAADEYEQVYQSYRTRLAGLYARMYQARCLQKQGEKAQAVEIYNELLESLPDSVPAFQQLKTRIDELLKQCKE